MSKINKPILITPHVINTINSLPEEERIAVASAFISDMIMGVNPENSLSSLQTMLYSIIKFQVQQDTIRFIKNHDVIK